MLEQFAKSCSLWEEHPLERSVTSEGPHASTGQKGEEEGAAEATHDELTTVPLSPSPCAIQGEHIQMLGVKLSLGRRQSVFKICSYFSLLCSDLDWYQINCPK